jgi:hypothetical protein
MDHSSGYSLAVIMPSRLEFTARVLLGAIAVLCGVLLVFPIIQSIHFACFDRDLENIARREHLALRRDANAVAAACLESGKYGWKPSEFGPDLPAIQELKPQRLSVRPVWDGTNTIGHVVNVRIHGGFHHKGLLIVVGENPQLDEKNETQGEARGWRNEKLADRVFVYAE